MRQTSWKPGILVLVAAAGFFGSISASGQEPELSAAEKQVVAKRIATLKASADRKVAEGWSNSKKMAELICRPAALPALRKQDRSIDRVFLGTDDPKSLTLESNQKLTGSGEYRAPHGWQDFTFICEVNPESGRVTSFQAVPISAKP